MATLTGLIPVTVGTFEAYHGGGGGGIPLGGGGAGNAERRTMYWAGLRKHKAHPGAVWEGSTTEISKSPPYIGLG